MFNVTRILYKLSGESLSDKGQGYDKLKMLQVCEDIALVCDSNVQVCITVGGGNIVRGRSVQDIGIDRLSGDYMGMIGTIMNAIALQSMLKRVNKSAVVLSALRIDKVCEYYTTAFAKQKLAEGNILIFAGGIGNPLFSTDTGAAIRSIEMECDMLIKGTTVDGVYSANPRLDGNAVFYPKIKYEDVIKMGLEFMDISASTMMMAHNISTVIFSAINSGTPLYNLLHGKTKHTFISN